MDELLEKGPGEGAAPTKYHDPAEEERLSEDIMHIFAGDVSL